jgi:hypothetical protein
MTQERDGRLFDRWAAMLSLGPVLDSRNRCVSLSPTE